MSTKLKTKRNGKTVSLPRYHNAEMLMLEFFAGERITIQPTGPGTSTLFTVVHVDAPAPQLDNLLDYINANI